MPSNRFHLQQLPAGPDTRSLELCGERGEPRLWETANKIAHSCVRPFRQADSHLASQSGGSLADNNIDIGCSLSRKFQARNMIDNRVRYPPGLTLSLRPRLLHICVDIAMELTDSDSIVNPTCSCVDSATDPGSRLCSSILSVCLPCVSHPPRLRRSKKRSRLVGAYVSPSRMLPRPCLCDVTVHLSRETGEPAWAVRPVPPSHLPSPSGIHEGGSLFSIPV